jgi:hypothetical protein
MKRALALALLSTAVLLAGIYVYLRPQPDRTPPAKADAALPADVSNAGAPLRMEFELTVAGGKLVSGPAVIQVAQGTEVTLRIRSDRADELHLHGYDLHARIDADEPAELTFTADKSGRFEYELHDSHLELGALEVRPE